MSSGSPRRLRSFLVSLAALLFLVAAKDRAVRLPRPAAPPQDVFTFSEPSRIVVRHLALDLTVDFDNRAVSGTATLDIQNFTGTDKLILDTRDLEIRAVTRDGRTPAPFTLGEATANGAPLIIDIEPDTHSVTIDYAAARARALVFLPPAETSGGIQPFVFSNNEPIGARTWIPIQDTPAVRMTYDATLRVPRGMLALMAADSNPTVANDAGIYSFHTSETVPAYLIAFAVGRLGFRAFDARSGFYAEPELIETAAATLPYVPNVMTATEDLTGAYPWGRYDILLMPPLYRGGMENPRLNFIGLRALTDPAPSQLIAHELSHSWAGDMVTLASWNDLWLNEGLATYLELRVLEPLVPKETIDAEWAARRAGFVQFTLDAPERSTLLHVPLTAEDDPNRLFGMAAYVKGGLFFHTLETVVGRPEFDRFLRAYIARFAWRFVDDVNFVKFLRETLLTGRPDLEEQLQLEEWLYKPGLPSSAFREAELLWRAAA